ncbi:MAG: TetR/AcrR family transcriptional regulator [Acidobacteriota bacterium]
MKWVKPPRQERSRDTHDRIVDAALRMLSRGLAFHEISVAELAKEADSSIGAFYSRFRDKDALLRVLASELDREGVATASDTFRIAGTAPIAFESMVRAFVALAVTYYRQQFGLRRALLVQMARDRDLRDRASALAKETCMGLVTLLAPRFPSASLEQLQLAVDVVHRIVYGTLDQWLLFADESPTGHPLDDKDMIRELTTAVHAYLRGALGAPRDAS